MTDKFSREQIARIFGVTEEELANDNGYAAAREEARREEAAFADEMRRRAEAAEAKLAAELDEGTA